MIFAVDRLDREVLMTSHDPKLIVADTKIQRLLQNFEQGKFPKIINSINRLNPKHKADPRIAQILGLSHYKLENFEQAEYHLKRALVEATNKAEILCNLGLCLQDFGKTNDAIISYKKALDIDPTNEDAYTNYASLLIENFEYRKAKNLLETALEILGPKLNIIINLCIAFLKMGQPESALRHIQSLEQLEDADNRVIELAADCYRLSGNLKKAFQTYSLLLNSDSKEHSNLRYKANLCNPNQTNESELKDKILDQNFTVVSWNNALSIINVNEQDLVLRMLKKAPNLKEAKISDLLAIVSNLIRLHQYELADNIINEVLIKDTTNGTGTVFKAQILYALDKLNEAVVWGFKAVELLPDNADVYNNLALYLWATDNHQAALINLNKSLELEARNAKALVNKSYFAKDIGRVQEAIQYATDALNLEPDNHEAKLNLSLALFASGQELSKAYELYEARFDIKSSVCGKLNFKAKRLERFEDAINKTVALWQEQGVADVLHYLCFAKDLLATAKNVEMIIDDRLIPLLKEAFVQPNIRYHPISEYETIKDKLNIDFEIPVADLPKLSKFSGNYSPPSYLKLEDKFQFESITSLNLGDYKKTIGLAWSGANSTDKRRKSFLTSLADWYPLIEEVDAIFVNINYINIDDELEKAPLSVRQKIILPTFDLKNDFLQLAVLLQKLDLVVGPLNTPAMLATLVGTNTIGYYKHFMEKNLGLGVKNGVWRQPFLPCNLTFDLACDQTYDFKNEIKNYIKLLVNK